MPTEFPRLWIDLDNSPHVPLFAPLIRHLKSEGWELIVTARNFAQTLDLVEQMKIDALHVGEHAGKNKVKKVMNLPVRTLQLLAAVRSFRPQIALSHGSRTQTLAARALRIPKVVMFDYEWTEMSIFKRFATHLLCPKAISAERLTEAGIPLDKVIWYDGFKEDLYLPEFVPDPSFRSQLGVGGDQRLVTIRPPGLIGNYHDSRSEEICRRLLQEAARDSANFLVVLPKTRLEQELVRSAIPENAAATVLIPEKALPGLQLLYNSDLAISGGGTMNREAALLGVPAYSMFTGRRAAIDEELARRNLLVFLESAPDVARIVWNRRAISFDKARSNPTLLYELTAMISKLKLLRNEPLRQTEH
jgi:predicted glycosyltransferase